MIQSRTNWKVTATLFGLVAVITWTAAIALAGLLKYSELSQTIRFLSVATTAATFTAFLLNRYLWRRYPLNKILKVPDMAGRWEGWSYRTLTGEWRPSAHEISQQALDIVINAWGPDNWSRSVCASIVQDPHGGVFELVWSYKTESTTPNYHSGDTHSGTHFFRLSERDGHRYLEGRYITDRIRDYDKTIGAGGFHRLVWVGHALKQACDYQTDCWGLPEPQNNPPTTMESPNRDKPPHH